MTPPKKPVRLAKAPPPPPLLPPRWFEYPLFLFFAVAFFLVLVIGDILQRLVFPLGPRAHDVTVHWINAALTSLLRILGMRVRRSGNPVIDSTRPAIIICNHQSLLDVPLLTQLFSVRDLKFIAKKQLAYGIPTVSFHLRHGKNCLINREDAAEAVKTIREYGELVERDKLPVVIFPEGTRARDGKMKQFRSTGFIALLDGAPSAQVIPVTIDGSWLIQARRFGPVRFGSEIQMIISPPLERASFRGGTEMVREAQRIIEANLTLLRKGNSRGNNRAEVLSEAV